MTVLRKWGRVAAAGAVMLLCLHGAVAQDVGPQQRNQRHDVEWLTPATTYLHYAVVSQEAIDPPQPLPDSFLNDAPNLSYAHYFGHEFDDSGVLNRIHMPLVVEDVLIQLAMHTPQKKAGAGFAWNRTWDFDRIYDLPALKLDSRYLVGEMQTVNRAECLALSGKHTFVAPAKAPLETERRWYSFAAETTGWFNLAEGRLEAAEITVHAAHFEPATGDKDARRREWHWKVRFEAKPAFDTTAARYLNDRVEASIGRGLERLLSLQNDDKQWPEGSRKRGGTGLALLTCLMCDMSPTDPRIVAGFEALKGLEMEDTYSVAVSLMAYEARYIPEAERKAYLGDADKFPEIKRDVSAADRAEMERLVAWLAEHQNKANPFWNYTNTESSGDARSDFSCTQYALLGLASALRCKVKIPAGVIGKLAEQILEHQQQDGPKVNRVVGYKPPKTNSRKEGRATFSTKPGKARGWAYHGKATWDRYTEITNAYGSMTVAGLTCVMVAMDVVALMTPQQIKEEFGGQGVLNRWQKAAAESVEDGMAWLEHWFSVTRNPNKGRYWYLYYLYGLERVMMMAHAQRLGAHDWYAQGAAMLVTIQRDNGSWGGMPDTCFALLFLKKGSVPARRVTTGGK